MSIPSTSAVGAVTWEDTASFIGKELPTKDGADAISLGWIRCWNEVIESDCPLNYDQVIAKKMGYKNVIAPASLVFAACVPAYWKPDDPLSQPGDGPKLLPGPTSAIPLPTTAGFVTDIEAEFISPMYPGDLISQTSKLTKILRKQLRVGDGAFITTEITFRNQNDVIVAIQRMTFFVFNPAQEGK